MYQWLFVMLLLILPAAMLPVIGASKKSPPPELQYPPIPVLAPSALTGYAANGRAYLDWNPSIEDLRVLGWHVYRATDGENWQRVTLKPIVTPRFVDEGLDTRKTYDYLVAAVSAQGEAASRSNMVTLQPAPAVDAVIAEGDIKFQTGEQPEVNLDRQSGLKISWANGQQIIFDKGGLRLRSWQAPDGTSLLQSKLYGNGIDLVAYDSYGMINPKEPTNQRPWLGESCYTRDYTTPERRVLNDSRPSFRKVTARDGRVTLEYWIPLQVDNFRSFTYAQIWETWWPIEREIGGETYQGLARMIEMKVPDYFTTEGFNVAINDGFGPQGSCDGVTSYGVRWGQPNRNFVTWSKTGDHADWGRAGRQSGSYHPDANTLQTEPFLCYDWDATEKRKAGSLLISAQKLYYTVHRANSDYLKYGVDGIWPNFGIDVAGVRGRFTLETFEYLYASAPKVALPQRYANAKMQFSRRISKLYGLQTDFAGVAATAFHNELENWAIKNGGLGKAGKVLAKEYGDFGVDLFSDYHVIWHSSPFTVEKQYRLDDKFGVNPEIAAYTNALRTRGMRVGYWMRPEFVNTSPQNAYTKGGFVTTYYGYDMQKFPPCMERIESMGLPEIYAHPEWARCGRKGEFPQGAPYGWVPMSLASSWWDEMMWPTLVMSHKLGYRNIFVDGGFGSLSGVDYRPLVNGARDSALPVQPYWWRFWRQAYSLDMPVYGECMLAWGGANDFGMAHSSDMLFPWFYTLSSLNPGLAPKGGSYLPTASPRYIPGVWCG